MIAFITSTKFFPAVLMTLYVGAAIRCAFAGQWPQVLYWVSACSINFSAAFLMK